jgi:hypothetical protein
VKFKLAVLAVRVVVGPSVQTPTRIIRSGAYTSYVLTAVIHGMASVSVRGCITCPLHLSHFFFNFIPRQGPRVEMFETDTVLPHEEAEEKTYVLRVWAARVTPPKG